MQMIDSVAFFALSLSVLFSIINPNWLLLPSDSFDGRVCQCLNVSFRMLNVRMLERLCSDVRRANGNASAQIERKLIIFRRSLIDNNRVDSNGTSGQKNMQISIGEFNLRLAN